MDLPPHRRSLDLPGVARVAGVEGAGDDRRRGGVDESHSDIDAEAPQSPHLPRVQLIVHARGVRGGRRGRLHRATQRRLSHAVR